MRVLYRETAHHDEREWHHRGRHITASLPSFFFSFVEATPLANLKKYTQTQAHHIEEARNTGGERGCGSLKQTRGGDLVFLAAAIYGGVQAAQVQEPRL